MKKVFRRTGYVPRGETPKETISLCPSWKEVEEVVDVMVGIMTFPSQKDVKNDAGQYGDKVKIIFTLEVVKVKKKKRKK